MRRSFESRRSAVALRGLLLLGLSFALPAAAMAQRLAQGQGGAEIGWWRVIGALALCLALAVGAAFALKSRFRVGTPAFSAGPRRLQLVETLRLSHQTDICLVHCDGREWMIADSPHGAPVIVAGTAASADPEQPQ